MTQAQAHSVAWEGSGAHCCKVAALASSGGSLGAEAVPSGAGTPAPADSAPLGAGAAAVSAVSFSVDDLSFWWAATPFIRSDMTSAALGA